MKPVQCPFCGHLMEEGAASEGLCNECGRELDSEDNQEHWDQEKSLEEAERDEGLDDASLPESEDDDRS